MKPIQKLHDVAEAVNNWIIQMTPHRQDPPVYACVEYYGPYAWAFSIGDIVICESEDGFGDYPSDGFDYGMLTPTLALAVWRWHLRRLMLAAGMIDGGVVGGGPS